jgi:hypothetical protein
MAHNLLLSGLVIYQKLAPTLLSNHELCQTLLSWKGQTDLLDQIDSIGSPDKNEISTFLISSALIRAGTVL